MNTQSIYNDVLLIINWILISKNSISWSSTELKGFHIPFRPILQNKTANAMELLSLNLRRYYDIILFFQLNECFVIFKTANAHNTINRHLLYW